MAGSGDRCLGKEAMLLMMEDSGADGTRDVIVTTREGRIELLQREEGTGAGAAESGSSRSLSDLPDLARIILEFAQIRPLNRH
jgi:hypothetical protein